MDKIIFSRRLSGLRKSRGYSSQYALAKAYNENFPPKRRNDTDGNEGNFSGILGTIKNYENENNDSSPKLEIVLNLCKLLGCNIGYLVGDYDELDFPTHKICELTGLSEPAVLRLCKMEEKSIRERAAGWRGFPEEQELTVLNTLLEQGFYILYYLYQYLFESYDSFNFVVRSSENSVQEENRDDILLCCKDNPNKGTFIRAAEVQTVFLLKIQEEITKLKTQLNGGKRNG